MSVRNMTSSTKEVLDRHKAFWDMEDVNQPLLATLPSSEEAEETGMKLTLADGTTATEGLLLKPHMLSPKKIHPRLLHFFRKMESEEKEKPPYSIGDIFSPMTPYGKIPWSTGGQFGRDCSKRGMDREVKEFYRVSG